MNIDWHALAEATRVYRNRGYRDIETPWLVSEEAYYVTIPPGRASFELFSAPMMGCCGAQQDSYGFLVSSAEQGFIDLMLNDELSPVALYQSTTPCFRDDEPGDLHQRYFMKLELCRYLGTRTPTDKNISEHLAIMLLDAEHGMLETYSNNNLEIISAQTGRFEYDLTVNGIEVGSYGYRTYSNRHWIYGTGLALPRMTIAIERGNQ